MNTEASYAKTQEADNKINIIYSGDCAKWQNADLMIKTIALLKNNNNYTFSIFTKQIDAFNELLQKYNCTDIKIESKLKTKFFQNIKPIILVLFYVIIY